MKASSYGSFVLLAALGCGAAAEAPDVSTAPADAGASVATPTDALPLASLVSDACAPLVEAHEAKYRAHVARDTEVTYDSNPPSWGLHYATWVEYGAHRSPIDRREYVHNAEHGAIVFLYRCESAEACPSVANALARIAAEMPEDSACFAETGVRARVVITPDPLLDTPIAAMAWGNTYTANCFDAASLRAFALAHYGQGPENNCNDGGGGALMAP